jgi:FkbH-like protein
MKLIEALEILRRPPAEASSELKVFLACGFEPLHLRTFLAAHLCKSHRGKVTVETGLFGDLCGNIERLDPMSVRACIVVLEWQDLDPRLGVRNLGGWLPSDLKDVAEGANRTLVRIEQSVSRVADRVPTVVCLPTLPLPPLFPTRPDQAGHVELHLRRIVVSLAERLSQQTSIQIVGAQVLDETSPAAGRYDLKEDVSAGFPYGLGHASAVAEVVAGLIQSRPPKKGVITDLDDTLWGGILGEDGVEGVSWALDGRAHLHGLYQQFLASLASAGTLVGVASKNEAAAVDRVFSDRKDLLISNNDMFPFEVHWTTKSQSVQRILAAWNVGADSVVFIDDSPMEVAEVQAAFPELECIVFPKHDYPAFWRLLRHLRYLFGKRFLTTEDAFRLSSIRDSAAWREVSNPEGTGVSDEFLKAAEGCVAIDVAQACEDQRAFELINKTNQFNLNGRRFTEQEWKSYFINPRAFLLTASYNDKYGALGKVAVMVGKKAERKVHIDSWVMSCRAFSRRIEYHCLQNLFEILEVDDAVLNYEATARNTPFQQFLRDLFHTEPGSGATITSEQFAVSTPALLHRVERCVHA